MHKHNLHRSYMFRHVYSILRERKHQIYNFLKYNRSQTRLFKIFQGLRLYDWNLVHFSLSMRTWFRNVRTLDTRCVKEQFK
jgi:hypothetical protein